MKPWTALIPPLLAATAFAQAPKAYEQPVALKAYDLLPTSLLAGKSHRVRELVVTDGYMAHFQIDTDFGTFTAIGVPQVQQRVLETEAIRILVETSKSDLFAEGLKRSITQPIDAVKNIVDDPVDSLKQAPATVGHFFGKIGSSISRGVTKTADRIDEAKNTPGGVDTGQAAAQAGRGIGNAAKNAAGFDKAKLDTAKQLGVDPYADNPRLQEEMEKVTWAFFAGGLPLRVGAAVASAGIAVAATEMVGIPEDTYALTSGELAQRDEDAMEVMKITDEDISIFQTHRILSTSQQHRIVTCLTSIPEAHGRGNIIRLASSCQTPEQVDFLINALTILVNRHLSGETQYVSLKVLGRLPAATLANGEIHVPAPVDYVTWTEQVAHFALREDLRGASKVLVHTGRISPAASSGLAAGGWQTIAVPYPIP